MKGKWNPKLAAREGGRSGENEAKRREKRKNNNEARQKKCNNPQKEKESTNRKKTQSLCKYVYYLLIFGRI
jgi:hypothetical protein